MAPSSNLTIDSSSATSSIPTSPWIFDNGASHHAASNRSSLHTLSEYGGPDEIVLRNGKSLPIFHTGHTSLPTPTRSLNSHDVFLFLNCENRVSVAKLCKSNNVLVGFFPYHFVVKDLRMEAKLMRAVNINAFYYAAINSLHNLSQINAQPSQPV
ncbi:hypothetical protein HanRHA438_Chr07g0317761 [Helianthus annuus]|nr:hypothetical protein HanRHA438_Chr07g0317761 [Helianthus annuus]